MPQDILRTALATVHGTVYELPVCGDSFDYYGRYDEVVAYYHGRAMDKGFGPIEDRLLVGMVQEERERFHDVFDDTFCVEDAVFHFFWLWFDKEPVMDIHGSYDNGGWRGEPLTAQDILDDPQFEGITYV